MTSPLLVNTHLNRLHGRWQPSTNTSTIREEDGLQRGATVGNEEEVEDDDDDDNVALGQLSKHNSTADTTNNQPGEDDQDPDDEDDEDGDGDNEDDDDDEDDEALGNEDEDEDDSSTFTSSPSIPDENIDFDLVYTLHTFEATVEGQASVVKGDSLTLLDDSNSYWWLVKVLKSNEVGYIPAENIETPFERLARLNKHRNVEVTAIQQASHYTNPDGESAKAITNKKQRKQVTMSKDIYYQSHIILLGDDDEELEETYEEWEDDMVDEDSQSTMLASEDDGLDTSDTEMDHHGEVDHNHSNNTNGLQSLDGNNPATVSTTADEEVQGLRITTPSAATTSNGATEPAGDDDSNNKSTKLLPSKPTPLATTAAKASPLVSPTTNGTIYSPKDDKDSKKHGGSFLRLFSRGKRQDGKKQQPAAGQSHPMDNTSSDQGSTNSSTISDELQQHTSTVPASSSTSSMAALDPSATVLRVYAGNINVNATYNSVLVYDHTNAEALLRQAMDRFHISQIEGKARGKRSSVTSSPSQYPHQQHSSGVEYYISVKPNDGDELTLLPQDKPLIIYQSLTAHLTTPMPSLSNLKQQITNVEFGRIGSPSNNNSTNKRTGTKFGEDSIRFYLHKRIKRVNEQDGKLYVKVSLYHDDAAKRERKNSDSKDGKQRRATPNNSVGVSSSSLNSSNSNNSKLNNGTENGNKHSLHSGSYTSLSAGSFSMRRKKSTSSPSNSALKITTTSKAATAPGNPTQSQIDKLIAVSSMATVADLIDIALEKFHLLQQPGQEPTPRYRMLIVVNSQGPEKHLNPSSKLVEVLHDDTNAKNNTTEKRFVLRKVATSSSSSRSGNSNTRLSQHHRGNTPEPSQQQQKQRGEELDTLRSNSTTSPLLTPIPVMQLDTDTEMILRRLERALVTFHDRKKAMSIGSVPPRLQLDPQQPKLAVMRNVNQGVDVYLPHGILRSKPLPPKQTQYVLMANDKNKDSSWELVTQRVLTNASASANGAELVADADLKALIKFATLFLEAAEARGLDPSVLPKEETLQPSSSLSSLDELERELQRIMASHTIS